MKEKSVAMARLYLISANKMARNLDGDMRQGPTMCACPLGFIQQIITINARQIKLQPFIQEVLQKFTYI
jgi:hypothetical protein